MNNIPKEVGLVSFNSSELSTSCKQRLDLCDVSSFECIFDHKYYNQLCYFIGKLVAS